MSSIGVVMVELILGCLTGGQSTRNGRKFDSVYRINVKDKSKIFDDGWKRLIKDADPSIVWNAESLEVVCKAASIQCMAPSSDERLCTNDLLPLLNKAIQLHDASPNSAPPKYGCPCAICNRNLFTIKYSKGHALCASCIENTLRHGSGCQLSCLINGCSSQPFQDNDLFGRISVEAYNCYIEKRTHQAKLDQCIHQLHGLNLGIDAVNVGIDAVNVGINALKIGIDAANVGINAANDGIKAANDGINNLAKGLDRSLAALSLLAAHQFEQCPNLVWVTPISVEKKDWRNRKHWIRNASKQKYKVVFACARSGEPGHEPFEIDVSRGWIAKIAAWLKLCLLVMTGIATAQGLPFPIPDLKFLECKRMTTFLDSLVEEEVKAALKPCETLLENGTMPPDAFQSGQVTKLTGEALE